MVVPIFVSYAMVNLFTITQLTREFDISTRTLRFYEDEGLIRPERRGRTRLYTGADRHRIDKILCARRVGFSVAEIAEMLELQVELPDNTRQLRAVMDSIEKKRGDLRQQRRDLEAVIDDLDNLEDSCLAKLAEIGVGT